MSIEINEENKIPELLRALNSLRRLKVEIGIFGEGDTEILMIASVHEFGSMKMNIPERSYMRAGFDENKDFIFNQAQMLLSQVLSFQIDGRAFYEAFGGICVSVFQKFLTDLSHPPLSPKTIAKKGSSNPLIDTGRLRSSITYRVVGA